jgi:hypothetical protein
MRSGVNSLALLACATLGSSNARACSKVWNAHYAKRYSDAVVWGTFLPSASRGEGTIQVTRRIKGPKISEIVVRWNPDYISDGADCGQWEPNLGMTHGRFFLLDRHDGTYVVDDQVPMQKVSR